MKFVRQKRNMTHKKQFFAHDYISHSIQTENNIHGALRCMIVCLLSFRDLRVRKYLGVRYDARLNLFDWDYQMRLAQRDVSTELSL